MRIVIHVFDDNDRRVVSHAVSSEQPVDRALVRSVCDRATEAVLYRLSKAGIIT